MKSLRLRIALVFGASMCLLLVASLAIYSIVTTQSFGRLQDDITKDRIQRVARGIGQVAKGKMRLVRDSAEWDDTYDFISGTNPDYLAKNFAPGVDSSGQEVIIVLNAERKVIGSVQPKETQNAYSLPAGLDLPALVASPLLAPTGQAGLCFAGDRVLLLAACPVLPSNRDKPANGWLLFGHFFGPERTEELQLMSGAASIAVHPETSVPVPPDFQQTAIDGGAIGALTAFYEPARAWHPGSGVPKALLVMPAIPGSRRIVADIGVVFSVYEEALRTRTWIILGSILCGGALMIMGFLAVEANVITPLASLDRQISAMAEGKGDTELLHINRNDEIGRLAESANHLLQTIRAGRRTAEEHHHLVESILDSAVEGIIAYAAIRDAQGTIEDFRVMESNRAAERICQQAPGGLDGKTMLTLFPQLKGSDVFNRFAQVTTERQRKVFEDVYERENGGPAWMRIAIAPWEDGIVITFEDVTERKTHEKELAESYAEIDRFNAAMIGREERVVEIKREVNTLRRQFGLEPVYDENES